jgi:hypothetical protein
MVANAPRDFEEMTIRRQIYATGWDGTVNVRGNLAGELQTTADE